MEIPKGFCQCGCGGLAPIAKQTRKEINAIKGEPQKFISGHNFNGPVNPKWNGGQTINLTGYVFMLMLGHPRASHGYVGEHILVAEKALGKPLPPGALPHHVNEDKSDNRPENLVICQDEGYHRLLHRRTKAFKACGHASWRKCPYCKFHGDPALMCVSKKTGAAYHRDCYNEYQRRRKLK